MSIYEASVEAEFVAAHAIPLPYGDLEPKHKHTWKMTATFRSQQVDQTTGVVIDFEKVKEAMETIAIGLEGKDLNKLDFFSDGRASAERIAEFIAYRLEALLGGSTALYSLRLSEAPGCTAAFYPQEGEAHTG